MDFDVILQLFVRTDLADSGNLLIPALPSIPAPAQLEVISIYGINKACLNRCGARFSCPQSNCLGDSFHREQMVQLLLLFVEK
jgi:hypothetical protein